MSKDKTLPNKSLFGNNIDPIIKKAIRCLQPKTKFRSLFGATDTVSEFDKIYVNDDGEIYVHCNSGQMRLIYDGKFWADIL